MLPCINGAAVPVSPFEHVPSCPKAHMIILELRWCCPFWCGTGLPVAWSPVLCRKVEDSAYDIKLLTTIEASIGQGSVPFFWGAMLDAWSLLSFAWCTFACIFSGLWTRWGRIGWMRTALTELSPVHGVRNQIRKRWSTETSVQKVIKAKRWLQK